MSDLEKRLGVKFQNPALLEQALTHRSFVKAAAQNERLEFLGDAVLGFVTAQNLYEQFPKSNEGTLTQLRALYICQANLAKAAKKLKLGEELRAAKGMKRSGAVQQESILCDVTEAIIGAVFLDQGIDAARDLIARVLGPLPTEVQAPLKSAKTELQELIQAKYALAPRYEIVKTSGPAHQPVFEVRVLINNEEVAKGQGANKKEASERAAEKALVNFAK